MAGISWRDHGRDIEEAKFNVILSEHIRAFRANFNSDRPLMSLEERMAMYGFQIVEITPPVDGKAQITYWSPSGDLKTTTLDGHRL